MNYDDAPERKMKWTHNNFFCIEFLLKVNDFFNCKMRKISIQNMVSWRSPLTLTMTGLVVVGTPCNCIILLLTGV